MGCKKPLTFWADPGPLIAFTNIVKEGNIFLNSQEINL